MFKDPLDCGLDHWTAGALGLHKMENANWTLACIHRSSLLTGGVMWPVVSSCCCLGLHLELWPKLNPSILKIVFVRVFNHRARKRNQEIVLPCTVLVNRAIEVCIWKYLWLPFLPLSAHWLFVSQYGNFYTPVQNIVLENSFSFFHSASWCYEVLVENTHSKEGRGKIVHDFSYLYR